MVDVVALNHIIAAACNDASKVCLDNLPQPAADGSFIQTVLKIAIAITAALSVLFIAIGGVRYIFSQGDPGAVSKAKSTIVFALIGLVIAVMAQIIVAFVIGKVSS